MRAALAALTLILAPIAAPAAPPAETPKLQPVTVTHPVFIVRHMQKAEGTDPSLNSEGAANAERLAAMLAGGGIVAVFATPTKRAMETAAPLAKMLGMDVTPYDPSDPAALAAKAAAAPGPVLIVGHSNTVPDLVELFGGARPAPIGDQEYGTVYGVDPGGTVEAVALR
jgi:broad specificity phosphatase PhoE